MNGRVILYRNEGGKENVQACKGAIFDLQDIDFSFRERVSQEQP